MTTLRFNFSHEAKEIFEDLQVSGSGGALILGCLLIGPIILNLLEPTSQRMYM